MDSPSTTQSAHIGKSVRIKGEVSGSEDLFIDGNVEGNIRLDGNKLTIGQNGQVRANISATTVTIGGKLEGNVHATDRAELKNSAVVMGDIVAHRVAIEDGAYFKGSLEIQRESSKVVSAESKAVSAEAPASATSAGSHEVTKTA